MIKTVIWAMILIAAVIPAIIYFYQRWRQSKAEREGLALYATVISVEPLKRFGKQLPMAKIELWIQEPDKTTRNVILRSRIEPGQTIEPGMRLVIVVDPKNPKRIYPAGPLAAERVTPTGSRSERRQMKSGRGIAPSVQRQPYRGRPGAR